MPDSTRSRLLSVLDGTATVGWLLGLAGLVLAGTYLFWLVSFCPSLATGFDACTIGPGTLTVVGVLLAVTLLSRAWQFGRRSRDPSEE